MWTLTRWLAVHLVSPGLLAAGCQGALEPTSARAEYSHVWSALTSCCGEGQCTERAQRCAGFTGADLQNLMNEAAILAARRNLKEISKEEISDALERLIAGPEKKGAVMAEKKRKLVAYHEVRTSLGAQIQPVGYSVAGRCLQCCSVFHPSASAATPPPWDRTG